jgi:hypothetical protein
MGNRLEIDIAEKGKVKGQMIAPLILLPFIENSFSSIDNKKLEKNWINLEFQVEPTVFMMKLIHGKAIDLQVHPPIDDVVSKTIKRLDYFYADRYQLKTTVEPEMMMTSLKIILNEASQEEKNIDKEQLTYAAF